MVDKEYLEQLRAEADEIREDIAEREAKWEEDPIASHEAIMAATQPNLPRAEIVYKTMQHSKVQQQPYEDDNNGDNGAPFTDLQMDIISSVIFQIREETQGMIEDAIAPLRERIATLEGSINMLMSMLGSDNSRAFEASEVVRKLKVTPR